MAENDIEANKTLCVSAGERGERDFYMSMTIFSMEIRSEREVLLARQRAGLIAKLLGFKEMEQTRISTAASEIIRNAFMYAGMGKVEYIIEGTAYPQVFMMRISDQGPGINNFLDILEGRSGPGSGIISAKRLMDYFHMESSPGRGTTVLLGKPLPSAAPVITGNHVAQMVMELVKYAPQDSAEILWQQNREIIHAMEELHKRQEDLVMVNRELEDTNRGVLALYAELEEKAEKLRQTDIVKTSFFSHMSHEFRTPINSITALSQILLDRTDGDLTPEQEKQLLFINKAGKDLLTMVNDLLDLARIEAGKTNIRTNPFTVSDLFSALRGMMKPLQINKEVSLIFENPSAIPPLYTDEGKVSQILRNLVSNALKFTEKGEVRISAGLNKEGAFVIFSVADTGIGIASKDQELIFQEFTQLESSYKKKIKGTGLGLSLSRKLAYLLGGNITFKSQLEAGSTFTVVLPMIYPGKDQESESRIELDKTMPSSREINQESGPAGLPAPAITPVLVIEDDLSTVYTYQKYLMKSGFQVVAATSIKEAREVLKKIQPLAIILDILLPGEDGWSFLSEMKENESTGDIPILVATVVDNQQKGMLLGADDYCVKPVKKSWLVNKLKEIQASRPARPLKILIIDDEEVSRYLMKTYLADTASTIIEAVDGPEGLRLAAAEQPQVIFLDLVMPEMSGLEVLERLKSDPATSGIPVIIVTSKILEEEERRYLAAGTLAVLSKETKLLEMAMAGIRDVLMKIRVKSPKATL